MWAWPSAPIGQRYEVPLCQCVITVQIDSQPNVAVVACVSLGMSTALISFIVFLLFILKHLKVHIICVCVYLCVCFFQDVLVVNCSTEFMASNHVLATCRTAMRRQGVVGLNMAPCMRAFLERLPVMLQEQYAYEKVSLLCLKWRCFSTGVCAPDHGTVQIDGSLILLTGIRQSEGMSGSPQGQFADQ